MNFTLETIFFISGSLKTYIRQSLVPGDVPLISKFAGWRFFILKRNNQEHTRKKNSKIRYYIIRDNEIVGRYSLSSLVLS